MTVPADLLRQWIHDFGESKARFLEAWWNDADALARSASRERFASREAARDLLRPFEKTLADGRTVPAYRVSRCGALLTKRRSDARQTVGFFVQQVPGELGRWELLLTESGETPVQLGFLSENEVRKLYALDPADSLAIVADAVIHGVSFLAVALK